LPARPKHDQPATFNLLLQQEADVVSRLHDVVHANSDIMTVMMSSGKRHQLIQG
jgi:hypothetical protein